MSQDNVLAEMQAITAEAIDSMQPGQELDFGWIKFEFLEGDQIRLTSTIADRTEVELWEKTPAMQSEAI